MDDSDTEEIQKKALLFESQYNRLKKEFRDYIENSRKNEALKKKELQSDFAKKMLVFADSLCRISPGVNTGSCDIVRQTCENFQKNIDSMYCQLLSASDLTPVEPVPGEKFNDELHMAVGLEYGSRYPDGSVFSVVRKGYMSENILVRPAEVIISKFPREEIKNKKERIWSRIRGRVFPSRYRFDLFTRQIDDLEHVRSETTLRFEEEINNLKEIVTQTLAEKEEIERHMREQVETIERLEEEIGELKEVVSQSLEIKQDIKYSLQVQAKTIERIETEMVDLKETVSENFNDDMDAKKTVSDNSLIPLEKEDYNP